jgi:hypothetical protein
MMRHDYNITAPKANGLLLVGVVVLVRVSDAVAP